MPEQTKPQSTPNDLNERVKNFNAELIPLLGKYSVGLSATPFITPDGKVLAKPIVFDDVKPTTPAPENTPSDNSQTEAPASPKADGETTPPKSELSSA